MTEAVIALHDISLISQKGTPLERKTLSNINLRIERGETVGIIGPPGSGKTTLAKVMSGLLPPSSGEICTPGVGYGKTGMIFQFPEHQLFCSSVYDEITYTLKEVISLPEEDIEDAFLEACRQVDLAPGIVRCKRPDEMSGGERRRVAIASILAMKPEVIIFDEPTAGLDQGSKDCILEEIGRLSAEGKTTVIISHDLEELLHVAQRIVYMEGGKIAADGEGRKVLLEIADRKERFRMLPFVTELMVRLSEKGLDVRRDIFDPDEALEEIKRALGK